MFGIVAPEVLIERQHTTTPMNAFSEFLSIFSSTWATSYSVAHGGAVVLVVMTALIGMMSVGEPDDPTDL
jgi:hypothetical protein